MATENTTRVSIRLKTDICDAIRKVSEEAGMDFSTYIQRVLERDVYDLLPPDRRKELDLMDKMYVSARKKAQELFEAGIFDEHFTRTVFRELMKDPASRKLYEELIGTDAYTEKAPKKTPLNMYLGWYIKNAVDAEPLMDERGKPRRAFVKGEPIKSYTLLRKTPMH